MDKIRINMLSAATTVDGQGVGSAYIEQVKLVKECDDIVEEMRDEYDARRRFLVREFNRIGLHCFEPKGAFYTFPSIRSTGFTSDEFCEHLLYEKKIAVIPGSSTSALLSAKDLNPLRTRDFR